MLIDYSPFFPSPDVYHINNLFNTNNEFKEASGMNINCQKTDFLGINLDTSLARGIGSEMGLQNWKVAC